MKTVLFTIFALLTGAWGFNLATTNFPPDSAALWIVRQEALNLTGLLSIGLMSLSMLLSTRPQWLESPLGGLDRVYRLHKWSGILALALGAAHWLAKQSSSIVKALIGSEGRLPKVRYDGLLEVLRELGKDMGEPALYAMLLVLALTLWRRFPYHLWRHLHRVMPVLYLMLAVHAAMLAPPAYWTQPVGALLALILTVGAVSSVISLGGLIGRRRRVDATVTEVRHLGEVTEITCRLDQRWQAHRPGQFAFITVDRAEGAHPFTIASADRGDRTITFFVKALGSFTRTIAQRVEAGQQVVIEGPYGRFLLARHAPDRRQIWVAAGIGLTPFLAWLEALCARPGEGREADLHYCTRDRDNDPLVARLRALCAALPGIRLTIHSDAHGGRLTADALRLTDAPHTELWYCGPQGLANALKRGFRESGKGTVRFHQEAFAMR